MVQGWFVCVSVFWKIMNNFWTDGPIWTKFSGLSRLVAANLGVGTTSAQSPPVTTGPAFSPFPCSLSPLWSWVLLGRVIPFWKAFNEANHNVREDFWVWTCTCTGGLCRLGLQGGLYFFTNWPIFHTIDSPWNQILRTFHDAQLFHRTSCWGCMALAWPLIKPCTRNASPPWLLVLMGKPFWKAFHVLNKWVRADFWFWVLARICS